MATVLLIGMFIKRKLETQSVELNFSFNRKWYKVNFFYLVLLIASLLFVPFYLWIDPAPMVKYAFSFTLSITLYDAGIKWIGDKVNSFFTQKNPPSDAQNGEF